MIKIDIEMPESCLDCLFNQSIIEIKQMIYVCFFTGNETGDVVGRRKDCKLIDGDKKTCEACKNISIGYCNIGGCENMNKWQAR